MTPDETHDDEHDQKRVDPRYDPAFQRGFDGPVTSALRSRSAQRPSAATSEPIRVSPAEPGDPTPAEPQPTQTRTHPEPDSGDDRSADAPRRITRNPILVALVVLGAALTLGGIAWANQARLLVATRGGAATDLDYWFLQASVVGAPLTIIAGIGVLAGVLFIAAMAWNRQVPH